MASEGAAERTADDIRVDLNRAARMLDAWRRDAIIRAKREREAHVGDYMVGYHVGLAAAYEVAAKAVRDAAR